MPSAVIHGAVPLLFLLAVRPLDARKVWILWPLTFLPDLDYFLGFHRATFTNLFVLLPWIALFVWDWRAGRRARAQWWLIAFAYLASHLVMDMLTGGIVPFYPFSDYTVCYYANILVHTTDNSLAPDLGACSHGGIPQVIEYYPWLTDNDAAMLAFLVPAALLVAGWQLWRRRTSSERESR